MVNIAIIFILNDLNWACSSENGRPLVIVAGAGGTCPTFSQHTASLPLIKFHSAVLTPNHHRCLFKLSRLLLLRLNSWQLDLSLSGRGGFLNDIVNICCFAKHYYVFEGAPNLTRVLRGVVLFLLSLIQLEVLIEVRLGLCLLDNTSAGLLERAWASLFTANGVLLPEKLHQSVVLG